MEYRACQGGCGLVYPVGTLDEWVGRNKYKIGEGVVGYTEEPFEIEIYDKLIMMWLCEGCWYASYDET